MKKTLEIFSTLLRKEGLKATSGRITILNILTKFQKPVSIPFLRKSLRGQINEVTIYRTLETLTEGGLVQRVDLGHAHAHYEIIEKNRHHHHLICKTCGRLEDITGCISKNLEKTILENSKKFKNIISHSVELFGICKQCIHA